MLKTSDISGATTAENPQECDVYVLGWAKEGITIDLSVGEFAEVWVSALLDEGEEPEYEIVFTSDDLH